MQNSRYFQCDDSCNIKMYSDAIFINELNNCKFLYFLSYINIVTINGRHWFGVNAKNLEEGIHNLVK